MAKQRFNALPGFGLTLGFTLFYLTAIVLIPFAGLVLRTLERSWTDFFRLATTDRALAACARSLCEDSCNHRATATLTAGAIAPLRSIGHR